jgi:hypothetical protein
MDFVSCDLRNFSCSDYNGAIEIKHNNDIIFYLLYNDIELLKIPKSYMYSELFGILNILNFRDHYFGYVELDKSIIDTKKERLL